jgi:carbonic anhydrase/acetyltransferase-like protein (isoleucine patch superfamily)
LERLELFLPALILAFRASLSYRERTSLGGWRFMIIEYKGKRPKISPTAFIAPTAVLIGDVTIGDEASIWWGAVIRSDQNGNPIVVGARTSIQDNCVLHSGEAPTIIEEDCTVGHCAVMEGPLVRRAAIIGMNVTLLEDVEIGEEALIAAGSVVVPHTKIPPRVLAAGSPAKVKKELAGEALNWIKLGSSTYVNLRRSYMGGDYKVIG